MANLLKQSTLVTVDIGPLRQTDGITALTASQAQAIIQLSKNGGTYAQKSDTSGTTHDIGGLHKCALATADVSTLGILRLYVNNTTALAAWHDYMVVPAITYDALVSGSDLLDVSVTQWNGTTTQIPALTTRGTVALTTADIGTVSADMVSIGASTAALSALKSQFDGTGISGGTYPATQAQVSAIASTGGTALNTPATGFTLSTGTQTGTYSNTYQDNGVYHQLTDSAGTFDGYYEFNIGGDGQPVQFYMKGYGTGINDTWGIYAYRWSDTTWIQIGSFVGTAAATIQVKTLGIYATLVGTGANIGKVRIRVYGTGLTTSNLYIDQCYVSYAVINRFGGYEGGSVYLDTVDGTAGTEAYVNGTVGLPVDTLADALTIMGNLGLHKLYVLPGSSVTLSAAFAQKVMDGSMYSLNLNGQDVHESSFNHCEMITGSGLKSSGYEFQIKNSHLGACTLQEVDVYDCAWTDTVTLNEAISYFFENCWSVPLSTPVLDFGSAIGGTTVVISHWAGAGELTIKNMKAGDTLKIDGIGKLILDSTCSAGDVSTVGPIALTDNSTGTSVIQEMTGGGATAQEVWEYVISGSQAQTYLTQLLGDVSVLGTDIYSLNLLCTDISSYLVYATNFTVNDGLGFGMTYTDHMQTPVLSITLPADTRYTLMARGSRRASDDIPLGYWDSTGWHWDAGVSIGGDPLNGPDHLLVDEQHFIYLSCEFDVEELTTEIPAGTMTLSWRVFGAAAYNSVTLDIPARWKGTDQGDAFCLYWDSETHRPMTMGSGQWSLGSDGAQDIVDAMNTEGFLKAQTPANNSVDVDASGVVASNATVDEAAVAAAVVAELPSLATPTNIIITEEVKNVKHNVGGRVLSDDARRKGFFGGFSK